MMDWSAEATRIDWVTAPTDVCRDRENGLSTWFAGGELNTCFNAVDRHVAAGRGEDDALVFHSAMTGRVEHYSFSKLQTHVAKTAGMIRDSGVMSGDRVIIYMPMVPEAVFAMLACARIGAVHSVVFGGFSAEELSKRIDDAQPKLVLSASCGLEPGRIVDYKAILDDAFRLSSHAVTTCIMLQRQQLVADLSEAVYLDWDTCVSTAEPVDCVPVASDHPLYILYTSGTTGQPKGVVRDTGGHAVALRWSMEHVYGAGPGDVFWAASDIGWVVGHSYIVYASLIAGCTTVLFEGKPIGTPDAETFWRVIAQHSVNVLFTAPTAIRAIKREDPDGNGMRSHDLSSLRALFLAGERADPPTVIWAEEKLGLPIIDHWWQTELGWPALGTCLGDGETETRLGSAGRQIPAYEFDILGEDSQPLPDGELGDVAIRLPLPPGCLPTLWNNNAQFEDTYLSQHAGYYTTGDAGRRDADGFLHIMGRTDDLIMVAGHRLSTGAMEQVVAGHPDVAECAVVGVSDAIKGMVPVGLVVLKAGVDRADGDICREVVETVRDRIGPVAAFKSAVVVPKLPTTRSGKVLRAAIRRIADAEPLKIPPTIDDPTTLETTRLALQAAGYAREGDAHAAKP